MPRQAHALVQDAQNADFVHADPVNDDVRADQIGQLRRRQMIPAMVEPRAMTKQVKGVVDLVSYACIRAAPQVSPV